MSIEKVSFKGVEALAPQPTTLETKVAFKGHEKPIDEEKSNTAKLMIGATAVAGLVALGIAGYKGHLGEGIQKFLGGAKKAVGKEGAKLIDEELFKKNLDKHLKDLTVEELRQSINTFVQNRPVLNEVLVNKIINECSADAYFRDVFVPYSNLMEELDKKYGKVFMDGVFGNNGIAYKKFSELKAKDLQKLIESVPDIKKTQSNPNLVQYLSREMNPLYMISKLEPETNIAEYMPRHDNFGLCLAEIENLDLKSSKSLAENKKFLQKWFYGKGCLM